MSGADFVPELPQVLALTSNFVVEDETDANSDDESTVKRADANALLAANAAPAAANAANAANAASSTSSGAHSTQPQAATPARTAAAAAGNAAQIPDVVRTFVEWWYAQFRAKRTFEIHAVYESHWNKLTDRYYKASAWPTAESIAGLVENDGLFLLLYQTLWFKHLFSKLPVSLEARTDAWQNSVAFFDYLLEVKDARDVEAELPLAWVWYIVDAFVNQVQDMAYLRSAIDVSPDVPDRVCDVNVAIGYLERLIDKSTIVQCLKEDRKVGFGQHSLYYTLGYFSIIGLARLRCSLGDYEGTLRVAAPIDVSKKGLYSRAIAAYVALFHSLALAHLMQRQHVACVTVASTMLHFVSRTKQYHQRSYIYHNMIQTSDRLYALLALCSALYSSPLDDQLRNAVRDRFGENMARVTRGNTDAFEELFLKACVRLLPDGALAPAAPPAAAAGAGAEKRSASSAECARVINSARRAADKAAAVRASKLILTAMPQLRSILRLYSTISVSKLAGLLEVDNGTCRQQLDAYLRESPAAGSDVSFRLEGDMLHVIDAAQATSRKTPGEIFARQIRKLDDLSVGAHAPAAPASSSSSSNKE